MHWFGRYSFCMGCRYRYDLGVMIVNWVCRMDKADRCPRKAGSRLGRMMRPANGKQAIYKKDERRMEACP